MSKIYVTRMIPEAGIEKLKKEGHEVDINPDDRVLSKEELIKALKNKEYDAVLCLLTDKIDTDVFEAAGAQCKVFANYAVGYDNIDLDAAAEKNILISNTPGVLSETVAEHTFALMLAISHRIAEADKYTKAGAYKGWAPKLLLGNDLSGKVFGVVGLGRIGSLVAKHAKFGFNAQVLYYDLNRNEEFEKETGAEYKESVDELLKEADYVSVHVPLLDSTKHLINKERLSLMKNSAYLVNTSRGPVIDEEALVDALESNQIKGAALDVFENEPYKAKLVEIDRCILTAYMGSVSVDCRSQMESEATGRSCSFSYRKTFS